MVADIVICFNIRETDAHRCKVIHTSSIYFDSGRIWVWTALDRKLLPSNTEFDLFKSGINKIVETLLQSLVTNVCLDSLQQILIRE